MDNTGPGAELTCAMGGDAGRVYVGAADGSVRAIAANGAGESGRWRVCVHAVTSVCGAAGELLLVGSAGGELVVLRERQEARRFQLESAVLQICRDRDGEFVVGDALGNLYGVTQYEVLWKRRLPAIATRDDAGAEFFYPAVTQPAVKAIVRARLLDVEKTLSNYVLVTTGQKHVLVTHRGKDFGAIPTPTPIGTVTSLSGDEEDVVLAAGEEGVIYRLVSYRNAQPKERPELRFSMEVWARAPFPIAKLLPVNIPASSAEAKPSEFSWICLGADGEIALFHGQKIVKQSHAASFNTAPEVELGLPVDFVMLNTDAQHQSGAIVFSDRVHTIPIELTA